MCVELKSGATDSRASRVWEKRLSEVSVKALTEPRFPGHQNSLITGNFNTKILGLTQTDLNYGFPLVRAEPKQSPIRYSPQTLSVSPLTPSPKEIARRIDDAYRCTSLQGLCDGSTQDHHKLC